MIMAIDQSSNVNGLAIFSYEKKLINYNIINLSKLPKSTQQDQTIKRRILIDQIDEIVQKYDVKQIITEGIYYHQDPKTYAKLAMVLGSIHDYCETSGIISFTWENAGEWRSKLGIKGTKREIYKEATKQYVLNILPHLPNNLENDIYDAVGIALGYFVMFE
jgi:Holliday junction resolvasome RuvABC endonuclease subunit